MNDLRMAYAQQLLAGNQRPAGNGPGAALAGAGQNILGAMLARKSMEADQQDRAGFAKMLTDFQGSPAAQGPDRARMLASMLSGSDNPMAQEAGQKLLVQSLMGNGEDPEKFYAPMTMQGPDGPRLVQPGTRGGLRPIEGYTPAPENKPSPMRTITRGDTEVQQEFGPEGWRDIGSGPRWAPRQEGMEPLVEIADPSSPTGVRYVPRSAAGGAAAPQKGMAMSYDAEGRPIITMGGAQAPGMAAKVPDAVRTKYAVQKPMLASTREQFNVLQNFEPGLFERMAASGGFYGPEGAKANSARNSILFSIAQLSEQGALQAPDRAVAENILGNIFDPRVGPETRAAGLEQFDAWLRSKEQGLDSMISETPPASAPVAVPGGERPRPTTAAQPAQQPRAAPKKSTSLKDAWDSFK